MTIERHAKALAAFAVPVFAHPAFLALIGTTSPPHYLAALALGVFTGLLTALAVWRVPNRTHGYNVADIAEVLIKAGFAAVESEQGDSG